MTHPVYAYRAQQLRAGDGRRVRRNVAALLALSILALLVAATQVHESDPAHGAANATTD